MFDSPAALWLRTSLAYPILETLHIIGLATLFGSLMIVDLRLLGLLRRLDLTALARSVLPCTLAGFALAAATGMTMFYARAGELIANPVFTAKIGLVMLAGCNAGMLHARGPLREDFTSRCQAGLSVLIWIAVIICGRWIAYI
ncbi:hypothetical protein VVD49_08500 [Uliginosibacterium sp. H3]|uniref:DUF2214 domain-containing protein n=1 Tax=Uliginosibacterium silvisoli TaxID=3114758 RepID=A0ABU6K2K0_9RHOO|nr:hypothetical protein [Uliginosibacterium sp. H3]